MKFRLWGLMLCTLFLFTVTMAFAEETAPNRSLESLDPRLEKMISQEPSVLTLTDLTKKMTESTGVTFSVDPGEKMWQVRQRKVDLVLKNLGTADLMKDLKKLFRYSWKMVGDPSAGSYEIYQSKVDILREKRALRDISNAKIQEKIQAFQDAISGYSQTGQLSPDEAAKIKDSDPYGYLMATWGPAKAMGNLLSSLPQNVISSLVSGEKYVVPFRDMSPQMRKLAGQFYTGMKAYDRQRKKVFSRNTNGFSDGDTSEKTVNWDNMQLIIEPAPSFGPDPGTSSSVLGTVKLMGDGEIEFPIMKQNSPFTQLMSCDVQHILNGQDPFDSQDVGMKSREKQFPELMGKSLQQTQQTYSGKKPPTNPSLLQNVTISEGYFKGPRLEVMKQLSDLLQISVISDDYPETIVYGMGSISIPAGTMPVYQLLNQVSGQMNRIWSLYGSAILWQDPEWATKRTYDVPQTTIDKLNQKIKDGTFGLQDMLQMASLTNGQLVNGFSSESKLDPIANSIWVQHDTWNLLASFSDDQKNQMQADSGMPCSDLTQSQYKLLWKAFGDPFLTFGTNVVAQGSLKWLNSLDNRVIDIKFINSDPTSESMMKRQFGPRINWGINNDPAEETLDSDESLSVWIPDFRLNVAPKKEENKKTP